jgi:hypothetical protein
MKANAMSAQSATVLDRILPPPLSSDAFLNHLEYALGVAPTLFLMFEISAALAEYVDGEAILGGSERGSSDAMDLMETLLEEMPLDEVRRLIHELGYIVEERALATLERNAELVQNEREKRASQVQALWASLSRARENAQRQQENLDRLTRSLPENALTDQLKLHVQRISSFISLLDAWLADPEMYLSIIVRPRPAKGRPVNPRRERLAHRTMDALERSGFVLSEREEETLARVLRETVLPAADTLDGREPRAYERLGGEIRRWLTSRPCPS